MLSAVPGLAGDEPRVNSGEFDPGLTPLAGLTPLSLTDMRAPPG